MKKQAIIDQSQKDYTNFFSGRKDQSAQGLRKKNSKLMELNTFKIGGDNRELSKKMKYQDYNDNLTLNPTKNYQLSGNSSNINNNITSINDSNKNSQLNSNYGRYAPQKNNFNIITGNDKKEFNENPMNHTSNEYKQMINNENFDQYGRQIGNKPVNPEYGSINNQGGQGMQGNPPQIKGIENLENFSPYYDHYNYRPVSGTNNQKDNTGMYNTLPYQGGYVQDKNGVNNFNMKQPQQQPINSFQNIPQGYPNSNSNPNPNYYENYKIEPIKQSNNSQNQQENYYQGGQGQGHLQPKTTGKKVDLNSVPIPDHINTVEDYEKYLISLGIDPLTLEYISENPNSNQGNNQQYQQMDYLEKQMGGMNINSGYPESMPNDKEVEKIKNDYGGYQGYQGGNGPSNQSNNQQSSNQDRNNAPKLNQQVLYDPHLPNYGTRPTYKNQSTLLLADASAHTGKGNTQFEKKDYEPFVKNKPLVINPCK